MRSKYNNKKTIIDGIKFDSRKEALHFLKLKALEAEGKIHGLRCQVPFFFDINQKTLRYVDSNRVMKYIADFEYFTSEGVRVVCDVKGVKTRDYLIKKALMMAVHNILVLEI